MKHLICILLLLALGCSRKVTDLDDLCKNSSNSYECAQIIEKYQIPYYSNFVKRTNQKLTLAIDNGSNLVLENNDKEEDGIWYSFRDYMENINSYIIDIQYYEGGEYYLINKFDGKKIIVPGMIKIAPDNLHFVSYNLDLEAEYSPNGFVIYKLINNTYIKEYESFTNNWGPSNIRWISNNEIEVEKMQLKNNQLSVTGKINYELKNNTWAYKE